MKTMYECGVCQVLYYSKRKAEVCERACKKREERYEKYKREHARLSEMFIEENGYRIVSNCVNCRFNIGGRCTQSKKIQGKHHMIADNEHVCNKWEVR